MLYNMNIYTYCMIDILPYCWNICLNYFPMVSPKLWKQPLILRLMAYTLPTFQFSRDPGCLVSLLSGFALLELFTIFGRQNTQNEAKSRQDGSNAEDPGQKATGYLATPVTFNDLLAARNQCTRPVISALLYFTSCLSISVYFSSQKCWAMSKNISNQNPDLWHLATSKTEQI